MHVLLHTYYHHQQLLGTYSTLFESPISPFTTLGPLIIVLAVSMLQEGATDLKRHRSDDEVHRLLIRNICCKIILVQLCLAAKYVLD
jgi:hypothetical protein